MHGQILEGLAVRLGGIDYRLLYQSMTCTQLNFEEPKYGSAEGSQAV